MRIERRCTTHPWHHDYEDEDCEWHDVYVIPVDKVDVTFVPESEEVSIRGIVGKRVLVVEADDGD